MFQLKQIGYAYSNNVSLRNVNLTIQAGEAVAIMGPNGSGKSTLFKLLNGLIQPDTGNYLFKQQLVDKEFLKNPDRLAELHQTIGFVFQNSDVQLFNETVSAELAFGPQQLGLSESEVQQRVSDCLQLLGIEALAQRVPYHLSGGEKKLVALGSILTMNPSVIMLDEPFNGLSSHYQTVILTLLNQLHAAGKTVILSSHNFEQVKQVVDRLVVFDEQHTIAHDTTVATAYQSPELLQLLKQL